MSSRASSRGEALEPETPVKVASSLSASFRGRSGSKVKLAQAELLTESEDQLLSASLRQLLTGYQAVHAVPGRLRFRPRQRGFSPRPGLDKALAEHFPGAEIKISPRSGSILIVMAHAPNYARLPAPVEEESVPNPVPAKVRSFFYPRFLCNLLASLRSIPYIGRAIACLFRGNIGLDLLDGSALLVCLLQRDFRTLSSITFFFALGDYLADWTRKKTRASLAESLALNIDQVWIRFEDSEVTIPFVDLQAGHEVIVRAGSSIPVDGEVIVGHGMVNQAAMTGESMPVQKENGSTVYAGTVLEEGELIVRAVKVGSQTRINAILRTIEDSERAKSALQGRYERMADSIVPYNFLLSGAVYGLTRNLRRAGSVLLVDYSCAIRLTSPLSIFSAMQEAAAHGILIKGGKFMEAIAEADVVVFDKTGTLTRAKPEVVGVIPFGGRSRENVLRLAACLEEHFVHPVGQAVVRASEAEGLHHREEHTKVEFRVAHGIASTWREQRVLVGSQHFVAEHEGVILSEEQQQIVLEESDKGRSLLYLSIGGELAALILIEDQIRDETSRVVSALRLDGVKRVIMLTGDGERTAAGIAARAGISEYKAQMLPEEKAEYVQELKRQGWKVAMVGDGINDSPALSAANVGVAMAEGSDMAREVADLVLTNGRLEGLLLARKISRLALGRVHGSFRQSLFWNSLFLLGGLGGVLTPNISAFLHNATTAALAVASLRPVLGPEDAIGQED